MSLEMEPSGGLPCPPALVAPGAARALLASQRPPGLRLPDLARILLSRRSRVRNETATAPITERGPEPLLPAAPLPGGALDEHRVQAMEPARMQTESAHVRTHDGPFQANVDGDPRQFLGQHGLGSLVEALSLGAERELAGPDQNVVERSPARERVCLRARCALAPLARRERIEEKMRISPEHGGFCQHHADVATRQFRPR